MGGGPPRGPSTVDSNDGVIVYVIGDLEGQLHALYNLLIELKVLKMRSPPLQQPHGELVEACLRTPPAFEWTGAPNVYFLQCGDQVDAIRIGNTSPRPHFDLETLLFTDYLQTISKGHFINIIGNHEWMNVTGDFAYTHASDASTMSTQERHSLFGYNGTLGKILRRRHMVFRINDALFSHGGIHWELVKDLRGPRGQLDQRIDMINALVDDRQNYDVQTFTSAFKRFAWGPKDRAKPNGDTGILWTRVYKPTDLKAATVVPAAIRSHIRLMVTGHNKTDGMMHIVHEVEQRKQQQNKNTKTGKQNRQQVKVKRTNHRVCVNTPAGPAVNCEASPLELMLPKDSQVLLMSDTIVAANDIYMQYACLTCDAKSKQFQKLKIDNYTCKDEACMSIPLWAFFQEPCQQQK